MGQCFMDSEEKKSWLTERRGSCVIKCFSVLSVFAMMLTIAVLARNEALIRQMKMTNAELSQGMQRGKPGLNQIISHNVKANDKEDGTSGTFCIERIKNICQAFTSSPHEDMRRCFQFWKMYLD